MAPIFLNPESEEGMMRMISAGVGRLWAFGAALGLAISAAPSPSLATADGPIADPKIWCGEAAKTISDKDTEKFIDSFVFAAGHLIDRPTAAQAFAALGPALAREGEALSPSFLLEKAYGDSFSRTWFLIQFENGPLFMRCEGIKRGKGWLINSVIYNNESDKVSLP
jgi:hypothetical protein